MSKLDPKAVAFFYANAGLSFNPATETPEEGKMRSAMALARAERWARRKGYEVAWADDFDYGGRSHVEMFDGYDHEPETCEYVELKNHKGDTLASLGCVDDATDDYRRVVHAELALEAMGR